MLPLTGYTDRLSAAPGETISFQISSEALEPYDVKLVRALCGDPNPDGPGIREEDLSHIFAGAYPSRRQAVYSGSYAQVEHQSALQDLSSFTLAATIWPTLPHESQPQGILTKVEPEKGLGFGLFSDASGVGAMVGIGNGDTVHMRVGKPLRSRIWYRVWASYDAASHTLAVGQAPLEPAVMVDDTGGQSTTLSHAARCETTTPLCIAAIGGEPRTGHFNGKIERPMVVDRAMTESDVLEALQGRTPAGLVAQWDFAQDMMSARIVDVGPHALHGTLVNLPARAMTGSNWTGQEHCWRHAPEQYGAIHFHDDDLYDCAWDTDFTFTVPGDLQSGVYAMRISCRGWDETLPFCVRPKPGEPQSNACLLIPTFTYTVYGNYARSVTNEAYRARVAEWGARPWTADDHQEYGLSTYNYHRDGSGICYASRLRPIITMRSGFLSYVDARGSGLRHFPADTHLIDWLHAMHQDVDIITDHDLDADGHNLIAPYKVVLTASHPEYHTPSTLNALTEYTQQGGRLMYLGGNGFYWKVALNAEWPGAVEIRRAEGGIRAWAAEPGESYNHFDGQYGGMWRRNGRPPQQLVGVGFTSQGIFEGSYYRRQTGSADPRVAWIFEGVEDEILGDFGLSGGGAAGFELDRADKRLGTPLHAIVLASSEEHIPENFILVHEEMLTQYNTWPGEPAADLIRADMIYFETPNDGAVFSVGSITFCGSLAHNHYDNNISRLVNNVLTRFRST